MENASQDHERNVLAEQDIEADSQHRQAMVVIFETRISSFSLTRSSRSRRSTGSWTPPRHPRGSPATTAGDGGKRHGRDEAQEEHAAHRTGQAHRRHAVTAQQRHHAASLNAGLVLN